MISSVPCCHMKIKLYSILYYIQIIKYKSIHLLHIYPEYCSKLYSNSLDVLLNYIFSLKCNEAKIIIKLALAKRKCIKLYFTPLPYLSMS